MTCGCRAASWMEKRSAFKSGDWVAPLLLPRKLQVLFRIPPVRRLLTRVLGPEGVYEWVIARTRFIDEVFEHALSGGVTQVLIIGAGFDTRAIRFKTDDRKLRIFELDASPTQAAKLGQYKARGITPPRNVTFVAMNLEKESINQKLLKKGFRKGAKTLVVAEGVFQYLKPEAACEALRTMRDLVGTGSTLVFDYAHASVLRGEGSAYGEARMTRGVARHGESWQFGLDQREVAPLLSKYSFTVKDIHGPRALENRYFRGRDGKVFARINGTQSIVLAERAGRTRQK
jgi:methyltransferase (TIGR00027 family)